MDEEQAKKILASEAAQQARLQNLFGLAAVTSPISTSENVEVAEIIVDEPVPQPEQPVSVVSLSDQVKLLIDEYVAAQDEVDRQQQRLITMRGGEANLTEDDRLAIENVRDMVLQRYERLLEM
jgi:hypothetical protein